jgi:hypothetical protein
LIICLFIVLIASGSFPRLLGETYSADKTVPERQRMIYDSMVWLASNAPNASVVSVGISEYRYLPGIFNVKYAGDYELLILNYPGNPYEPSSLISLDKTLGFNYVAVSVGYVGFQNYQECGAIKLVFENPVVAIFRVIRDSCTSNNAPILSGA